MEATTSCRVCEGLGPFYMLCILLTPGNPQWSERPWLKPASPSPGPLAPSPSSLHSSQGSQRTFTHTLLLVWVVSAPATPPPGPGRSVRGTSEHPEGTCAFTSSSNSPAWPRCPRGSCVNDTELLPMWPSPFSRAQPLGLVLQRAGGLSPCPHRKLLTGQRNPLYRPKERPGREYNGAFHASPRRCLLH